MKKLFSQIQKSNQKKVHVVFIGTKPDIIKQAPIYKELKRRGELVLLCHTGQHYDFRNSKAILDELEMKVDLNFKVKGTLTEKIGQIINQTSLLISYLRKSGKMKFHMCMEIHLRRVV